MSGKGYKPRERSGKQEIDIAQRFDCISHFVKLKGVEGYRCIICPRKPEFVLLQDALDHESSPGHTLARREIDRPPPPVQFDLIPGGEDEGLDLEYEPALGSWRPRASARQSNAPGDVQAHDVASSSPPQPLQTAPTPVVAPTSGQRVGIDDSDWCTAVNQWSELPNAHFTVPATLSVFLVAILANSA
ncbi:hypothetical protein FRC11_013791 [Ceratobasidium sp. 423]|nr:hypothetical protein FRC11_013791 [Ceratobasidium sp. 423]